MLREIGGTNRVCTCSGLSRNISAGGLGIGGRVGARQPVELLQAHTLRIKGLSYDWLNSRGVWELSGSDMAIHL